MTGRRAGTPDTAPMIRAAFKRAVAILEEGGKPLSTLVMDSLEADFLGTLRALSGFVPKELESNIVVKDERTLTDEELNERINTALDRLADLGHRPGDLDERGHTETAH